MRSVGVHQGLAPVLDVVRDARWGRVEETIGEDPYLVGTIGTAYVRGLESAGIVATLKHFVGYSASKAGRNLAPGLGRAPRARRRAAAAVRDGDPRGRRALGDELVHRHRRRAHGGRRHACSPACCATPGASRAPSSPTTSRSRSSSCCTASRGTGRRRRPLALAAGIDVELPTVKTFWPSLVAAVDAGRRRRGARRPRAAPRAAAEGRARPARRRLVAGAAGARRGATATSTPCAGTSTSTRPRTARSPASSPSRRSCCCATTACCRCARPAAIAVIGPNADDPYAVLGCYSFPSHVGVQHPEVPIGIELPTLREALAARVPGRADRLRAGARRSTAARRDGIRGGASPRHPLPTSSCSPSATAPACSAAARAARAATPRRSRCPGAQQELLDAVLAAGTPTVVTLLAGRPYALGSAATDAAARSCRRSSRARRAPARSPACSAGG